MPLIDAHSVRLANLRLQLLQVQRRRDFLVVAILTEDQRQNQQQRRRMMWVKPCFIAACHSWPLQHSDARADERVNGDFKSFSRMEPEMFHEMLDRVAPCIEKSPEGRPPLSPRIKLAITLRFLSTGNSYHCLAFNFHVAHNTISLYLMPSSVTILLSYSHVAPVQLTSHRTETVRCLHRCRTVSIRVLCSLFTSVVQHNPEISYGCRTESQDMWPRRLWSPTNRTMSNRNENRTRFCWWRNNLTAPVTFVTEV